MLTYTGVTAAQFASLQSSVLRHGLKTEGTAGVIKKLGAVVGYSYTPATQTLTVEVKHAPWTVRLTSFTDTVDAGIRAALQEKGQENAAGAVSSSATSAVAQNGAPTTPQEAQ